MSSDLRAWAATAAGRRLRRHDPRARRRPRGSPAIR